VTARTLALATGGLGQLAAGAGDEVRTAANLDDNELVAALLRSGDDELFLHLVNRHKDRVFRLAVSILGPGARDDAEDLTQEVFLLVYRKLGTFSGRSAFSTWLYRLTYNRSVERRRQARFRHEHVGDGGLRELEAHGEGDDPHRAAVTSQRRRTLLACIEDLPENQRAAIYLHYWLDRPLAEIAQLLGTRTGTVKSLMFRARKRIARRLGGELPHV